MEQQKKLALDMQKGQAACNDDMNCLAKLSQQFAKQSAMISYPPMDETAPATSLNDEESDGFGHPGPRGSYRHWDRMRGETLSEGVEVPTKSEAWVWVAEQLRVADAFGSASTTLPISGANAGPVPAGVGGNGFQFSGEIKVSLKSKFEPL